MEMRKIHVWVLRKWTGTIGWLAEIVALHAVISYSMYTQFSVLFCLFKIFTILFPHCLGLDSTVLFIYILNFKIHSKQRAYKNECGVVDLFHEFFTAVVMKQLKIFFTSIAELVHSISSMYTIIFFKNMSIFTKRSSFIYLYFICVCVSNSFFNHKQQQMVSSSLRLHYTLWKIYW